MITIKTPERYIDRPAILKTAGEYVSPYGRHALVIGGKTALTAAGDSFLKSLKTAGIYYEVSEFDNYVTSEEIEKYYELSIRKDTDLIIGVGGGRVLDLSKAVGDKRDIPVITVPTIAATCAAWSALTIVYDKHGKFSGGMVLKKSPRLVLADTAILAEAPARYVAAGIGDTLVKWYEAMPTANPGYNDIASKVGLLSAKLALDILYQNSASALKSAEKREITPELTEVIDSIIFLAGLVGGVNGGNHRAAVAHSVHNSLTALNETHESLHGEKVAFGLIVQFVLENKSTRETDDLIKFQGSLGLPVTLGGLGIKSNIKAKAHEIAKEVNIKAEALEKLPFKVNSTSLESAILKADELGRQWLDSYGRA